MKKNWHIFLVLLLLIVFSSDISGRAAFENDDVKLNNYRSAALPGYAIVGHRVGRLALAINNNGTFGTGFSQSSTIDFYTGDPLSSCEFPKGSRNQYLFAGAFWIGAIVGRDTLVSIAADGWSFVQEFKPREGESGNIIRKSSLVPNDPFLFDGAVSEEDYIMTYMDTSTTGIGLDYFGRPHIPLNIAVTQRTYAWSYPYAEDFILFDFSIKNIGYQTLEKVYMGIYVDGDVGSLANQNSSLRYVDDISGFKETVPVEYGHCSFIDTVNTAWLTDNDGDPTGSSFDSKSCPGVTGTRIIRTPADSLEVSFNWWVSDGAASRDFGPREKSFMGKLDEEFRDYRTGGLGTPEGDVNKYYIMSNREFDYDQSYVGSIDVSDPLWLQPPPELASEWSQGLDTRYLLSFGPFTVKPGEQLPITFSYVGGENLHHIANNIDNLPQDPDAFNKNLDFSDFGENAAWSAKVYDNPGIDTDGNGYFGKFRICGFDSVLYADTTGDTTVMRFKYTLADTIYYEGDGVPDFRGASPPPAPKFWAEPSLGKVNIRINGLLSETTKDNFSDIYDFEGYRVYLGRDNRKNSLSIMASYDKENYNKFVWDIFKTPEPGYSLKDIPFTIDSLLLLYSETHSVDDSLFNPSVYTRNNPYRHPDYPFDSIFYFEAQDYNVSIMNVNTPIVKTYPEAPYPAILNPDSADAVDLTEDGYLKYFEYSVTIEDLLPTVPWWVNVTAFDFGNPVSGVQALESSKELNAVEIYPLNSWEDAKKLNQKVYVWPNPYRIDGDYQDSTVRFEAPQINQSDHTDRIRRLRFANLPPKCTIKIFSLDGDLIREIFHDTDVSDPMSPYDEWDLITRNTQLIVSGLYYFTIESDYEETQIGKFVILM